MASTSETGHAKNVANFENLIGFCTGYGETYNPAKASLKLPALTMLFVTASTALQAVKEAKTIHDNATNAREIAFKPLKRLATKILGALAATDAVKQTVNDAKSVNLKIQGKRAVPIKQPDESSDVALATQTKTASISQQSFDKMVDNYAKLIETLTKEPSYQPNESELTVAALNTLLTNLRAKNSAVVGAATNLSNTRIARDKVLYDEASGLLAASVGVKNYIKSLFGASSPQFKQVTKVRFH